MYQTVFLRISVLFCLLFSCSTPQDRLPYYNQPDFTPLFVNEEVTHQIGTFSFTDQHGETITDKDIDGKIHIANFIFTTCGSICPVMTRHMKLVQTEFGDRNDVLILSFSVTPWIDSVSRLNRYAADNGITSPNWHLLTGYKGDIYKLARTGYFAEEDLGFSKDSSEFLHTEHILLIDRNRRIRGIYNGTLQLEIEQMIKDIRVLLKE
jgi:protein SCO1